MQVHVYQRFMNLQNHQQNNKVYTSEKSKMDVSKYCTAP